MAAVLAVVFSSFALLAISTRPVEAFHGASTSAFDRGSEFGPLRLKQGSSPKAVLEINLGSNENAKTLTSITVSFTGTSGSPTWTNMAATSSELLNLATTNGGIQLWKETGTAGSTGPNPFSTTADTQITLAASPVYGASNSFVITPATPPTIATDDAYYVVLQTKTSGVTNNNAFTVTVAANGVVTSGSSPTITQVVTQAITIDTTAPTLTAANPANNATGVPISSTPRMIFSEQIEPGTINPANITFMLGSVPQSVGVRSLFDGFELVSSSPPTYTSGSRFARLSTLGHSFFHIPAPGQTINPSGDYRSVLVGDVVVTQQGNFAPQLGLITNATLTSGTFSVNDVALNIGHEITLLATATATGLVSASTTVAAGDLIIVNTTANPTADRYNWHLVTTGAAVNASTLRLDDSTAAPTYVTGSRFSTIAPADTSAVNASSQVVGSAGGGINLQVGDLVFARVTAGADNLNSYAWHLVTTAENITTDAAPSTLRLDSASSAPTLAASSRISKLATAVNGLVTDTTTQFNSGDVMFAKTTANAGTNNAYAFHVVSGSATGASNTNLRLDNVTSALQTGATYTITAGVGITDKAGNPLASAQTSTFTTGSTGTTNTTPPFVESTTPQSGAQSFPTNAVLKVKFSVPMAVSGAGSVLNSGNVGVFTETFGVPSSNPLAATNTYDATTRTVTITPAAALNASSNFILQVLPSTMSETNVQMQQFRAFFKTSSGTDATKPRVLGAFPGAAASGVARNLNAVFIGFSEDMNPATINATNVTISPSVAGSVSYDPAGRGGIFAPTVPLAASTTYTVTVGTGAQDLVGLALDQDATTNGDQAFTTTFTSAGTADTTAPTVASVNADNFGIAVTFSEAMKSGAGPNAADNVANYTVESPVGTAVSLAGRTVSYDAKAMTARISGLSLQNGNTLKVTVSAAVHDLSGNAIATSGTPAGNIGQCTVQNSTQTGGNLGPGGGGSGGGQPPSFGQEVRVSPDARAPGVLSDYSVDLNLVTSIPLGGSFVLTFPAGFDVTAAAAELAVNSQCNTDLNGPFTGTVTIASAVANASARTVTVTTGGAATGVAHVCFELLDILNSTVPSGADQGGYTVQVVTRDTPANSNAILETRNSQPFFIGQAGTRTLTVNVFNDDGSGGGTPNNNVKDGGEAGIQNAVVIVFDPSIGESSATTNSSGVATIANLADGSNYNIFLDPESLVASSFTVDSRPQPLTISGNTTKNIGLRAAPFTVGGNITGPVDTAVDVFANSSNGFVVRTVNTGGTGTVAYTLPVQGTTTYQICVGPAIPDDMRRPGAFAGAPPTFTFMPPPCQEAVVAAANVTGKNFTLTAANRTITGTVVDSAGAGISGAGVFARPVDDSTIGGSSTVGFGTGGQTNSTGGFTLNVVAGTYLVGVFKPGMPHLQEKQITVPTSGNTVPTTLAFVMDVSTTGLTISGKVTDESGNPIAYAGVGGRKVTSTSNTTSVGGGSDNFVGGPTDSSGNYTLYVSAGTWVIEAFAPNFGRLGSKTVTVTTSSLTGQDFSATTLSLGTITGQATQNSVAIRGVHIRAQGSAGENMGITDSSGNYSVKVPAGTYTISCFFPGVGEGTPLANVAVTANTTTANQNCSIGSPITITVNVTDGTNAITGAFVDVRDANGRGNGTNTSTTTGANAVYVVSVPPGTYTVRTGHPAYGMIGSTANVSTTQTITYTAAVGQLRAVSGTVTDGTNNISGAWVSLTGTPTGQTNVIHIGAQTATNGTYTVNAPNGSYKLRADKPGYKSPTEATVTVNNANLSNQNVTLTVANRTISGTVTLDGAGVSNAFVDADDGTGGYAVAQTDATGAFSLAVTNGTWSIEAHSICYSGGPTSVVVSGANITGVTVTLAAISGCSSVNNTENVTPTSGGQIQDSNIGSNFRVNIPANALGTGSNAATVTTRINTAMPNPPTGSILKSNAITISAVDASGQPIQSLSDDVTVVVPYTEASIPSGVAETSLVLGVWNEATQSYDTLSTTVDTTANTLTAVVDHLSDFAPLVPTDPSAPATPTGFAAANTGSLTVGLSWSAVTGASTYNVYRSTDNSSYPLLASTASTSYTASGQAAGITTYYKVSAVNSAGNESAASAAVSIIPTGASGGGGGGASSVSSGYTTLTVTLPNGGEVVTAGSPTNITWTSSGNGFSAVRILLSADGGLSFGTTVVSSAPANGSYRWTVPTGLSGARFRVKIEGVSSNGATVIQDISDRDFEIRAAATTPPVTTPPGVVAPGAGAPGTEGVSTGPRFDKALAREHAPNINADKGLTMASGVSAVCESNTLVKGPSSLAVYYCGADGRRYVFMNEKSYFTWYTDFGGVQTISDADLARLPLGGVVTPRGGVRMVKIESDPKVYAIAPGGMLRWVTSEALALSLYGFDWNRQIDDIPVSLFARFTAGPDITVAQ